MIDPLAFVWAGMVLGVSFLATPIKFRAASLTLPVALDVGRATFHAFQKVEWMLAGLLTAAVAHSQLNGDGLPTVDWAFFGIAIAIVLLQTFWLIPKLDVRVAATIAGEDLERSHLHTGFAALEALKVLALITIGV